MLRLYLYAAEFMNLQCSSNILISFQITTTSILEEYVEDVQTNTDELIKDTKLITWVEDEIVQYKY